MRQVVNHYIEVRFLRGEISPATRTSFRETLFLFADYLERDCRIPQITTQDVIGFLTSRKTAPSTMRLRLSTIRTFFHWALSEGLVRSDPTFGIRPPKKPRSVPRVVRSEDVSRAIAGAHRTRERLILSLMVQEGLRAMEVANLEMGDVDFGVGVMTVHGKGGHERVLPISHETLELLERYFPERGRGAGHLIQSYKASTGLSRKYVARLASDALHRAGVAESGHALRHTMAHGMIEDGADLRTVQNALGHASLMTTQVYLPVAAVKELRQVMGRRRYVELGETA